MGPGFVVVADVLGEHRLQMSPRDRRAGGRGSPVGRSARTLGEGVRPRGGAPGFVMASMPIEASTASKLAVNLVSRSRMRNRNCRPASSRSDAKLRATWVTQGPLGLAVTPSRCTRRRSISIDEEHVEAPQRAWCRR